MTHLEIQNLLLRYKEGKCTEEEVLKIHQWYDSLNEESLLSLDDREKELIENRLLCNIRREMLEEEVDQQNDTFSQKRWWQSSAFYSGIAATVILSLGYILYYGGRDKVMKSAEKEPLLIHTAVDHMITIENNTNADKRITLEDKSVVILSARSGLVYPDKFSEEIREVQLVGDAFFQIAPNPSKPFCVYSGNLITKVLGTSFRIKSKIKDHVEVEVVTGKVSVFENKEIFAQKGQSADQSQKSNGVLLTPNQRATYFTESRHLITSLVEQPVIVNAPPSAETLVFSNTFLPDIFAGLQQEYGIEIVLANENLEKCTFTGDLSDLPLYEKLDLICKSNAAAYEVKGTRILINGIGCDESHAKDNFH